MRADLDPDITLAVEELSIGLVGRAGWPPLVRDVSFTVRSGRTTAIVGESGSGKSLTCLAVTGLLPERKLEVSGGRILRHGEDLVRASRATFDRIRGNEIGLVFQDPMRSLNPTMTIGRQISEQILAHGGGSKGEARGRAIELLDSVRVPSAARRVDAYPHELSGGLRQRVMIAMAISCGPDLLIADEPTTALDVTTQAEILDLLARLQRESGMSILIVTHDPGVVADIADDVVVMQNGVVVEETDVLRFARDPEHPYTQTLVSNASSSLSSTTQP